ncbi:MAG: DNA-3-methyladenine glycosylase [Bacillota bacterium]
MTFLKSQVESSAEFPKILHEEDESVTGLRLEIPGPFDIDATLECGQTFGWERVTLEDGTAWFKGVIGCTGVMVNFDRSSSNLTVLYDTQDFCDPSDQKANARALAEKVFHYFALDDDLELIYEFLLHGSVSSGADVDPVMDAALSYGYGLRILRQDPWECLISYISSAMNNIPAICKIIGYFRKTLGKPVGFGQYTFPPPEAFMAAGHSCIRNSRCGFRSTYILDAADKVVNGEVDLDLIENLSLSDARRELQKIAGVGPKVADCVLLFAYHRLDAFPVDRWVLRAMSHFYFDGNAITVEQAKREGSRRFGPFSGYAQEYLFHYARNYCHGQF